MAVVEVLVTMMPVILLEGLVVQGADPHTIILTVPMVLEILHQHHHHKEIQEEVLATQLVVLDLNLAFLAYQ
tara:strand:- start:148 stop:363 length:216 start_codon:yes stop_codon:yes gene_type:complete